MDRLKFLEAVKNAAAALKSVKSTDRCVRIEVKQGIMTVSGMCSYMRVWATCDTDSSDFSAAVKAETLISVLSRMVKQDVQIRLGNTMQLICDDIRISIPVLDPSECPAITEDHSDLEKYTIKSFASAVMQCTHALGRKEFSPMKSALHLEVFPDNSFRLTALDGYRVAVRGDRFKTNPTLDLMVYGEEFAEAMKLLGTEDIVVSVSPNKNYVVMESTGIKISINTLSGQYFSSAALSSIFHQMPMYTTRFNREDLIDALNITHLMSKNTLIDLAGNEIRICSAAQTGEADIRLPCEVNGISKTVKTAFNGEYLLDALNSIPTAVVDVGFNDPSMPCMFTSGDEIFELVLAVRR